MPGEHWVGEVKTRVCANFFNGNQDAMVRPILTYFWLKDSRPFMKFFVQHEMNFALNYAGHEPNERWVYAGTLYRLTSSIDIGGFTANKWQV